MNSTIGQYDNDNDFEEELDDLFVRSHVSSTTTPTPVPSSDDLPQHEQQQLLPRRLDSTSTPPTFLTRSVLSTFESTVWLSLNAYDIIGAPGCSEGGLLLANNNSYCRSTRSPECGLLGGLKVGTQWCRLRTAPLWARNASDPFTTACDNNSFIALANNTGTAPALVCVKSFDDDDSTMAGLLGGGVSSSVSTSSTNIFDGFLSALIAATTCTLVVVILLVWRRRNGSASKKVVVAKAADNLKGLVNGRQRGLKVLRHNNPTTPRPIDSSFDTSFTVNPIRKKCRNQLIFFVIKKSWR
jgi:hypothetical protein